MEKKLKSGDHVQTRRRATQSGKKKGRGLLPKQETTLRKCICRNQNQRMLVHLRAIDSNQHQEQTD